MLQLWLKWYYRSLDSNFMLFDLFTSYLFLPETFLGLSWFSFLQQKVYYDDNNNFFLSGEMVFAVIAVVVCIHHASSILVSSYKEEAHPFTCCQYSKNNKKISAKINLSSCPQLHQNLKKYTKKSLISFILTSDNSLLCL